MLLAGAAGVVLYVATWAVTGALWDAYDPTRQAISELFAAGAPAMTRVPMTAVLVLSGFVTLPFAVVLHRRLPGEGMAGPVAVAMMGVLTVAAAVFPCTAGCPGASASTADLLHTVVAGVGYVALTSAPLLVAWRIRGQSRAMVVLSVVLGAVGLGGFLLRLAGFGDAAVGGLLQRGFNTAADLWYVAVAAWLVGGDRRSSHGDQHRRRPRQDRASADAPTHR